MDECDESEDKAVLPAQKLQQPQPVQGAKDENSGRGTRRTTVEVNRGKAKRAQA